MNICINEIYIICSNDIGIRQLIFLVNKYINIKLKEVQIQIRKRKGRQLRLRRMVKVQNPE